MKTKAGKQYVGFLSAEVGADPEGEFDTVPTVEELIAAADEENWCDVAVYGVVRIGVIRKVARKLEVDA